VILAGDLSPGDPEKSLLIKAVRYQNRWKTCNAGRAQKWRQTFEERIAISKHGWKMGAPDPAHERAAVQKGRHFRPGKSPPSLAFKPIIVTPPAAVNNKRWVKNPIDAFVLAKLESRGMSPARQAEQTRTEFAARLTI